MIEKSTVFEFPESSCESTNVVRLHSQQDDATSHQGLLKKEKICEK
jgi:hypothetical protein